ncbi:MAG: tetratricopeptide repeat protein, partial [Mycobacteriales bacterium]
AAAFLREQGEPSFDAPNMLRTKAQAHLDLGDHGAATVTLDRAQALAEPLPPGEPFDRLRVHLARMRGEALLASGDRSGARAALEAALSLCEATIGGEDVDTAVVHNGLGIVGKFSGAFDEAARHYARAGEIFGRMGASDRVLGALHHNLGGLAHSRGDLITAERETRRALQLHTATDGPAHPDTAADRGQLGGILSELGRHEEADRELRRTPST